MAGYLDREGADCQGEGPEAAPSECSPRDRWSGLALHTKAQLLAEAGSMGASPPRPALGGLHAGMGGLSQLFLPPNLLQACYLLPCHLGTLPAPGGRSPRARPCRTMGSMNPGKRQRLVPALESREELARCPGAASVPGLHWLEAAVVVSTGQPILSRPQRPACRQALDRESYSRLLTTVGLGPGGQEAQHRVAVSWGT